MVGKWRTLHERRRGMAAAAFVAVCMLANVVPARAQQQPLRFFRIGTAATTGTYFVIGAEIANAISKPPGSRDCAKGGSCGTKYPFKGIVAAKPVLSSAPFTEADTL